MKLELTLRRVRSSLRTDVNTGTSRQSGTRSYNSTSIARGECMDGKSAMICADNEGSQIGEPGKG